MSEGRFSLNLQKMPLSSKWIFWGLLLKYMKKKNFFTKIHINFNYEIIFFLISKETWKFKKKKKLLIFVKKKLRKSGSFIRNEEKSRDFEKNACLDLEEKALQNSKKKHLKKVDFIQRKSHKIQGNSKSHFKKEETGRATNFEFWRENSNI